MRHAFRLDGSEFALKPGYRDARLTRTTLSPESEFQKLSICSSVGYSFCSGAGGRIPDLIGRLREIEAGQQHRWAKGVQVVHVRKDIVGSGSPLHFYSSFSYGIRGDSVAL